MISYSSADAAVPQKEGKKERTKKEGEKSLSWFSLATLITQFLLHKISVPLILPADWDKSRTPEAFKIRGHSIIS